MKLLHAADLTYKCELDFRPVIQVLANADIFFPMLVQKIIKLKQSILSIAFYVANMKSKEGGRLAPSKLTISTPLKKALWFYSGQQREVSYWTHR